MAPLSEKVLSIVIGTKDKTDVYMTYNASLVVLSWEMAYIRLTKEVYPTQTADGSRYRINFICLPNEKATNPLKEWGLVSSFGEGKPPDLSAVKPINNNKLLKAYVSIDDIQTCKSRQQSLEIICGLEKIHNFCVVSHNRVSTLSLIEICLKGDEGAPLVQFDQREGRFVLIGITLGGSTFDKEGGVICGAGYNKYARVSYYTDHLRKAIVEDWTPTPSTPTTPFVPKTKPSDYEEEDPDKEDDELKLDDQKNKGSIAELFIIFHIIIVLINIFIN